MNHIYGGLGHTLTKSDTHSAALRGTNIFPALIGSTGPVNIQNSDRFTDDQMGTLRSNEEDFIYTQVSQDSFSKAMNQRQPVTVNVSPIQYDAVDDSYLSMRQ